MNSISFFDFLLDNKHMISKVLIVNNGCSGSTGSLSRGLNSFLNRNGINSLFVYAFGNCSDKNSLCVSNKFHQVAGWLKTKLGCNRYNVSNRPTKKLIRKIKLFAPDVVIVECLNDYSFNLEKLFSYLKNSSIKTFVVNHALFYATGNCGYPQNGCTKYLTECKGCEYKSFCTKSHLRKPNKNWADMYNNFHDSNFIFVAVSDYVKATLESSPITKNNKCLTIINGIDVSVFNYAKDNKSDTTNIVFVCSDTKGNEKGFSSFIKLANMVDDPSIKFTLAGSYDGVLPKNVSQVQPSNQQEMSELYQNSSLTILTSKNETFSLPIAESLCCGTPVAFFKCGGPETICIEVYSKLFEQGDLKSFADYITSKDYLKFDKKAISKAACEKFDINKYYKSFYDLITEDDNK